MDKNPILVSLCKVNSKLVSETAIVLTYRAENLLLPQLEIY
jgi:hypothetical protein